MHDSHQNMVRETHLNSIKLNQYAEVGTMLRYVKSYVTFNGFEKELFQLRKERSFTGFVISRGSHANLQKFGVGY